MYNYTGRRKGKEGWKKGGTVDEGEKMLERGGKRLFGEGGVKLNAG